MMQHTTPILPPGIVVSADHAPTARPARAFTLIELLVAVSIIALVAASTFPILSAMQSGTRESAGYNTVAVATSAARQLATQNKSKQDPLTAGTAYQGTAALFTNSGDIRIVENVPGANPTNSRFAYADIEGRDYVRMPSRVGFVGVARNATGIDGLRLLAPPFAIRFNQHGNLVYGNPTTAGGAFNVYYSKDRSTPNPIVGRPNSYNPNAAASKTWNNTLGKFELPFNEVETVVAVIVYPEEGSINLTASGGDITPAARDRILETGRIVFFSRYTGAPLRVDFQ